MGEQIGSLETEIVTERKKRFRGEGKETGWRGGGVKSGQRVDVLEGIRRRYISQSQICLMKLRRYQQFLSDRCGAKQTSFFCLFFCFENCISG